MTEDIDPTDAIFVALALFLNAKHWSGDKRLKEGLENKGKHIVLTTKNLSTNYDGLVKSRKLPKLSF